MLSTKDPDALLLNFSRIGNHKSGLATFSMSILECFTRWCHKPLVVLTSADINLAENNNVKVVKIPKSLSINSRVSKLRPLIWLAYSLTFPKNQRIFSPTHHAVPFAKNQIITVHDLRPYFYPDSSLQKFYFHHFLPRAINSAKAVLTVSFSTKKLIEQTYRTDPNKIFVVPNQIDVGRFKPLNQLPKNTTPYLLMVGASWKHKNAHEVIENYNLWSFKYKLKIVSGKGQYRFYLEKIVHEYGLTKQVEFLDNISDKDLVNLYQNASALIYPSSMEGFGIPPLEAMACGTPVIVSNIDVFNEIYNDIPIYVSLGNKVSWQKAFAELETQDTANKIQKGLLKAEEFSQERMCKAFIDALSKIWPDIF